MNNSVYGKTLENLRLRSDIRLINDWKGRIGGRNLIARPNFKNCKIFNQNLAAIELQKTHILMDRPVITGMCILDISKVVMYKFLYDYLKPKYGPNVSIIYTDTDSYITEIRTSDVYKDIRDDPSEFDTSDYSEDNIYGIKHHNKKVPGKFKDELNGEVVVAVAGLRAKCYAVRTYGEIDKKKKPNVFGKIDKIKKSKGVKKNVLKKTVSFDDYYNCIKNNCIEIRKQYSIRSKNHNIYTISMEKVAMNPYDDRRYIIKPDCIETLAWGHYKIDSETMTKEYQYAKDIAQHMKANLKEKGMKHNNV